MENAKCTEYPVLSTRYALLDPPFPASQHAARLRVLLSAVQSSPKNNRRRNCHLPTATGPLKTEH